jgi:glutathione S-transferase
LLEERIRARLRALSARLAGDDWLDGGFSAGDLLMVTVLRRLEGAGLLDAFPNLQAYMARGKDRPAYRRAFDDQFAVFRASQA